MLLSLEAVTSGLQKPASLSISDALSRWLTTLSKSESKANPSFAISEMEINYLSFWLFFFLTPLSFSLSHPTATRLISFTTSFNCPLISSRRLVGPTRLT